MHRGRYPRRALFRVKSGVLSHSYPLNTVVCLYSRENYRGQALREGHLEDGFPEVGAELPCPPEWRPSASSERVVCKMGYSSFHETSNFCSATVEKGAREARSRAALQRRFRSAPLPDPSGECSWTFASEDSPQSGMRLADCQERHPRLQRAWTRLPHSWLVSPQARVRRFRRKERRGAQGDAPSLTEGVRARVEPLDPGDGRTGRLRGGTHRKAGLGRDHPGDAFAPSRGGVAQSEKVDHLPRSPVRKKKGGATD